MSEKKEQRPPQHQEQQPGLEKEMSPRPRFNDPDYKGSGKLKNKVALITGGDSGIGRAVSIAFAKEGADVAIVFFDEQSDAGETSRLVESFGGKCLLISGDVKKKSFCNEAVKKVISNFGKLDVLVNNAAVQHPKENLDEISEEQLEETFRTNIFSFFFMTQSALYELGKNKGVVINTTSVTAYRGSAHLLDYSSTKGAIVAFTRSLASNLVKKGIRVNGVAPGPIWTPLIPSTFKSKEVAEFGSDAPMGKAGEPSQVAPCYVFLASSDSSYMTGQVLHPNGGEIING